MASVVILGASPKPDRYAHKALVALLAKGHQVQLVNPAYQTIDGIPCVSHLADVETPVDTVTCYIGSQRMMAYQDELLALSPRRVVFNPGTEHDELSNSLRRFGIEVVEGCTLVMLWIDTF